MTIYEFYKMTGCIQKIFIYAVLNEFDEMADYFWEKGREAIPAALMASKLYKGMASLKATSPERKNRMLRNAR